MSKLIAPKVGEYWEGQGGQYVGLYIPHDGSKARHLIASLDNIIVAPWGKYGLDIQDANNKFDGRVNTRAILKADPKNKAALHVTSLEVDGHKDFYWSSQLEVMQCYINLGAHIKEVLKDLWVHSSTQCSAHGAWSQNFGYGGVVEWSKRVARPACSPSAALVIQFFNPFCS